MNAPLGDRWALRYHHECGSAGISAADHAVGPFRCRRGIKTLRKRPGPCFQLLPRSPTLRLRPSSPGGFFHYRSRLRQSRLAYRLPDEWRRQAIEDGGSAATELGPHGIYFAPRSNEEPLRQSRRRLALWCSVAACFTPRTDAPARALGAHPYCTVAARGSVGDYSRAAATCRVGPGGRADVSAMPPNGWRCSWIPLPIPDRHPIARY